jgi:hypothetical protein
MLFLPDEMRSRTDPERITIPFTCFFLRGRLQRAKKRVEIPEGYAHLGRENNSDARGGEREVTRRTLAREEIYLVSFFTVCEL